MGSQFGGVPLNDAPASGSQFGGVPVESPNVLVDSAESIPTGLIKGINNITKLPAGMVSFASGVGAQIGNKLHDNLTDDTPYTEEQQAKNIQNAEQFKAGSPIDGLGKWLENTPTFSQLGSVGSASLMNLGQGVAHSLGLTDRAPLTQKEIEDEATGAQDQNPLLQVLHQPQTGMAKVTEEIASALPSGKSFGLGPLQTAGMSAGGQLADEISPNNPSLQAAGMLIGGKAPEAVQSVGEGAALRTKGALGSDNADEITEKSDKNWEDATSSFKSSDEAGAVLTPGAGQSILAKVKSALGNLSSRHVDTKAELSDFEDAVNSGSLTLSQLNDFRKNFADSASDNTKSKVDGGGFNSDGAKSYAAKQAIQDAFSDLGDEDFSKGTPEAAAKLQEGINQWAKASRFDRVADVINQAGGDAGLIKKGFAKLVKDPNVLKRQGYTDEEIATLQNAAKRGIGETLERGFGTFGLDLGKVKNVALPVVTGSSSALVPGIGFPLSVAGTILRQTGKYAAKGKAQAALDAVNQRNTSVPVNESPPPPAAPILALPAPKTVVESDSSGRSMLVTPSVRESLGRSPNTAAEQRSGAQIEAENQIKNKAEQNWAEHEQAQQAKKEADVLKFAKENQTPISQIISDTVEKYKDSGIQPGTLGELLFQFANNESGALSLEKLAKIADKYGATYSARNAVGGGHLANNPSQEENETTQVTPLSYNAKVPQPDISAFAKAESSNNPNAKNPKSTASGLYQFTNKTWADMVSKYGAQTGINLSDKANPQAQATMATLLARDNVQALKGSLGRLPTKGELYAAHVLGATGATKLIKANPNQEAIMLFPRNVLDANRALFFDGKTPRTVDQLKQLLSQKVS